MNGKPSPFDKALKANVFWMRSKIMATAANKRDLEALIAETEKNRIQVQKAAEKLENLKAAVRSANDTGDRTKGAVDQRRASPENRAQPADEPGARLPE